jgi:hypothetical protein
MAVHLGVGKESGSSQEGRQERAEQEKRIKVAVEHAPECDECDQKMKLRTDISNDEVIVISSYFSVTDSEPLEQRNSRFLTGDQAESPIPFLAFLLSGTITK